MPRNSEYATFMLYFTGKLPDPFPPDTEVPASGDEVGWVKQQQVARAVRHRRRGEATVEDLLLIKHKKRFEISRRELWRAARRRF